MTKPGKYVGKITVFFSVGGGGEWVPLRKAGLAGQPGVGGDFF